MPNFFINVKERGAKKASKNIGSLTGSMKMLALQAVSVTLVVQGLKKSLKMSAEMEGVRRGFNNLAKASGFSTGAFNKFKDATDGTVASLELMKQANNAMLLGITDSEDQMAQMFDVAQRLGQSLGLNTVQAVESLVTGLGRQSKLMLDNLGIMVDTNKAYENYATSIGKTTSQLTDQERKTAFVNAAMSEANKLVGQLGEEQLTTKDKIDQMNTAFGDMAIIIGDTIAPIITDLTVKFSGFLEQIQDFGLSPLDKMIKELEGMGVGSDFVKTLKIDSANEKIETLMGKMTKISGLQGKMFQDSKVGVDNQATAAEQMIINSEKEIDALVDMLALRTQEGDIHGNIVQDVQLMIDEEQSLIDKAREMLEISYEIKALESSILALKIKDGEIIDENDKKSKKLGKTRKILAVEELAKYAKVSGTAEDAMKQVVKAESMEAVAGLIASIFKNVPFPFSAILAAGAGAAVSTAIDKGLASFATGADFVTSGPQMMMVGDNPSGMERVQVTPLGGDPAPDAPAGSNITLNISAPLVDETVVDSIIPAIREALRRGETLGIG